MRAAFVAAQAGKQVAVLAPTTLLVQQHLANFRDRFADWPVRIEALSRFGTSQGDPGDARGARAGQGRHRHRHAPPAARARALQGPRASSSSTRSIASGCATSSACRRCGPTCTYSPSPRHPSRARSTWRSGDCATCRSSRPPPAGRLAIKTFVIEWHGADAARGGAARAAPRRPDLLRAQRGAHHRQDRRRSAGAGAGGRVRIGHGQMRERELEQLMVDFYHRRFNVLVCTTIIESGIDVPTANTIMINRADHMGLAQLHQLRGRVGRSHHRAYAYLIAPPRKALARDAAKRLEAIESMEELGAGFVLATHDLEIRGAGELLGRAAERPDDRGRAVDVPRHARARGRALKDGREPDARPAARGGHRSGAAPAGVPAGGLRRRRARAARRSTSASRPPTATRRSMSSPPRFTTASGHCRRRRTSLLRIAKLKLTARRSACGASIWVRRAAR